MPTGMTEAELSGLLAGKLLVSIFSPDELTSLAGLLQRVTYELGEIVYEAGEPGDGLDILQSGRIHVLHGDDAGNERIAGTLTRGDHLGEQCLFAGEPHHVTLRAASDVVLWRLPRRDFSQWLSRRPELHAYVQSHLSDGALRSFIRRCTAFSPLNPAELRGFLGAFQPVQFGIDIPVVQEGDPGDAFYLIRSGLLDVVQGGKTLGELGPGDFFGELALLTEQPRAATVVPRTAVRLFRVTKATFQQILTDVPQVHDMILGVAAGYSRDVQHMLFPDPATQKSPAGKRLDAGRADTLSGAAVHRWERWPGIEFWRRSVPVVVDPDAAESGVACLTMVARFYGLELPSGELRRRVNVTRHGATMHSLAEAAEQYGLRTQGVRLRPDEFRPQGGHRMPLSDVTLPALAQWDDDRFVVVYRIARREIVVADPAHGLLRLVPDEFYARWNGALLTIAPKVSVREPRRKARPLGRYWPAMLEHKGLLAKVFVASVFIQLFGLAIPLVTQHVVDRVVTDRDVELLNMLLVGMVVVAATHGMTEYARQYLLVRAVRRIDSELLNGFFRHLFALPLQYFESRKIGDILARINDNEKIRSLLTATTLAAVLDGMTVVVYGAFMLTYSVKLSLVAAALAPVFVVLTVGVTPIMRRFRRGAFTMHNEMQSYVVEAITGIGTVKAMAAEQPVRRNWEDLMRRYLAFTQSASLVAATAQAGVQFFKVAGSALVLWYGANLVMADALTVGQWVAFNALVGTAVQPWLRFVGLWSDFQQARVAAERLEEVYGQPLERSTDRQTAMPPIKGAIRFDKVGFRYREGSVDVLRNIHIDIEPGQTVALLGRSGSGKTTLIHLLLRLYEPTEGRILIDGVDIRGVSTDSLRRQIGVVLQDNFLFSGTIGDNIALNDSNASMQDVITSAILAGAHEFVSELPEGYDTVIGPRGIALSGGQMQRLAIARALYFKPRVLVLDEATSALDAESEEIIQQNLDRILHDRTTLIIAHRLSTVRHAHRILVMDRGAIVEQGTHDELLRRKGLYFHWSKQQLENGVA